MARPKKRKNSGVGLDEIEHLSDRYYELFNQMAAVDDVKNPEEYYRLERESENEFFKALEEPRHRGILQKKFPGSAFPESFTEAEWIFSVALEEALLKLKYFEGKLDIESSAQDIALFVLDYYMRTDLYDHTRTKAEKRAFIKGKTGNQVIDFLRKFKIEKERTTNAEKAFLEDAMSDEEVAKIGNKHKKS